MHLQSQALQIIHFVGQESLCWGSNGAKGIHYQISVQPIDQGLIVIGAHITIARQHPLHKDSPVSMLSSASTSTPVGKGLLWRGTNLGLNDAENGKTLFSVSDRL